MRAVQTFEVSLKAFIVRDDGRALVLREADTGYWELPGGRIDVGEEWVDHATVLRRELMEELGRDVTVDIGDVAITWTRRRPTDGVFQIIVARLCAAPQCVVRLSDEHDGSAWIMPREVVALAVPPESGYHDGLTRLFACAARR